MTSLTGPTEGTLALAGAGEYLPGMEDVDKFLLERTPGDPRVVCLPTAAGKESTERIAYWSNLGVEHFTKLGVRVEAVEIVDRDGAMDPAASDRIAAANLVYLSGGSPNYLYDTLVGTSAYEAIVGVLANGGVVAGCSAGAMIWGERIPGLLPPPFAWKRGFNTVPGTTIIPHFDEIPRWLTWGFRTVNFNRPTMVGIEGDTALIWSGGAPVVRGKGAVVLWDRKGKRRFLDGQVVER
jgi:cyanophycinase